MSSNLSICDLGVLHTNLHMGSGSAGRLYRIWFSGELITVGSYCVLARSVSD